MSEGQTSEPANQTPSLVGQILDGRYRLTKKLGEGGMGEVYAGEHLHIEKRFAIKLLRPEIVSNQEAVKRFYQEARSASSIGHRNIIGIEDFGSLPDGRVYMCMELLNGAPLNDMIQTPMPMDRLLNIMIQTGHGLAAAHAKGIIHRDMKPENIYVTVGPNGEDVPKLLDFGIAKVAGNEGQNNLTRTGTIFGTPFYMAPEQALGNPVDARTDIYAVGVIMYEVFAGSLPFQGESFMGILTQHITTEPEPVQQRAQKAGRPLDPVLADIITRCLRKNPAERFSSMDELVAALVTIYRNIAGAGMSSYMDAFPVGSAQHPTANTPGPMQRPTGQVAPTGQGAPMGQTMMAGTPPPMGQPTPPPYNPGTQPPFGQSPQSGTTPALSSSGSGLYNPNSSIVEAPKSGGGSGKLILIVLVLLVVLGGGGAAAYFLVVAPGKAVVAGLGSAGSDITALLGSGTTDPKNGTTDPKNGTTDPKNGTTDPKNGTTDPKNGTTDPKNGTTDPKNGTTDPKNGSSEPKTVPVDAAVEEPPPKTVDAAVIINTPPPTGGSKVLVSARNVTSFEIWENGKKFTDGPTNVEVTSGEKRTFVIKAKGFKDRQILVDGKGDVKFSLDPVKKDVPVGPGSSVTPQMDCSKVISDPGNAKCRKQYCASHSSDTRCMADD